MACYEATYHTIWLRNFISALEVVHFISRPLKLFYDNSLYHKIDSLSFDLFSLSMFSEFALLYGIVCV